MVAGWRPGPRSDFCSLRFTAGFAEEQGACFGAEYSRKTSARGRRERSCGLILTMCPPLGTPGGSGSQWPAEGAGRHFDGTIFIYPWAGGRGGEIFRLAIRPRSPAPEARTLLKPLGIIQGPGAALGLPSVRFYGSMTGNHKYGGAHSAELGQIQEQRKKDFVLPSNSVSTQTSDEFFFLEYSPGTGIYRRTGGVDARFGFGLGRGRVAAKHWRLGSRRLKFSRRCAKRAKSKAAPMAAIYSRTSLRFMVAC